MFPTRRAGYKDVCADADRYRPEPRPLQLPVAPSHACVKVTLKSRVGLVLAFILMAAMLGMHTGCGGGGGGNSPPPQTRNFTITVAGTSGTINQQISASLTVIP